MRPSSLLLGSGLLKETGSRKQQRSIHTRLTVAGVKQSKATPLTSPARLSLLTRQSLPWPA
eukprot:1161571-Pelagomonas_calceolata.AAC.6